MTSHSVSSQPSLDAEKYFLDAAEVRRLLTYDPATGIFTWNRAEGMCSNWNARNAGRRAGGINRASNRRRITISWRGKKRAYEASLLAWIWMTGEWPSTEIDHENRIRSDDRWSNLRLATPSQNKINKGLARNNKSGHHGVNWDAGRKKWRAAVQRDRKRVYRWFDKIEDAAAFRISLTNELFGEFARAA